MQARESGSVAAAIQFTSFSDGEFKKPARRFTVRDRARSQLEHFRFGLPLASQLERRTDVDVAAQEYNRLLVLVGKFEDFREDVVALLVIALMLPLVAEVVGKTESRKVQGVGDEITQMNDRLAENEAWYLGMVADQESQYSDVKDWVSWIAVKYWAFLILRDIPSRYGIDLDRVVLVSICLVLFFAIFYAYYFRRQIRINKRKQYVKLKPRPDQKRAFRFRPFERFFQSWQTWERQERPLHPCKDALFLSGRAFFKLGLGTEYPHTRELVCIAYIEWILGMCMLIYFLFAVKNTLPIAVPFLAVAG